MFVTQPEQDEFTFGYTIYFFELAIALSGYLNGINPFDQPGVEAYKKKHVCPSWKKNQALKSWVLS